MTDGDWRDGGFSPIGNPGPQLSASPQSQQKDSARFPERLRDHRVAWGSGNDPIRGRTSDRAGSVETDRDGTKGPGGPALQRRSGVRIPSAPPAGHRPSPAKTRDIPRLLSCSGLQFVRLRAPCVPPAVQTVQSGSVRARSEVVQVGGDQHQAEDLVQDSLVKVLRPLVQSSWFCNREPRRLGHRVAGGAAGRGPATTSRHRATPRGKYLPTGKPHGTFPAGKYGEEGT